MTTKYANKIKEIEELENEIADIWWKLVRLRKDLEEELKNAFIIKPKKETFGEKVN